MHFSHAWIEKDGIALSAATFNATYCHVGIICDNCDSTIVGVRYKCGNCADYDLCEECEALEGIHDENHVFLKLRRPAFGAGRQIDGELKPMLVNVVYNESQGIPTYGAPVNWWHKKLMKAERRAEKNEKKTDKVIEKMKKREETLRERCERKMEKMMEKFERREEKMKRQHDGREGAMPSKKEKTEISMQEGTDEEAVPLLPCTYATLLDKMDARFVRDGNMPDDTHVQPGTKFIKHWVMTNQGTLPWNADTRLKLLWGSIEIACSPEVEVPPLSPGLEATVSVEFEAPKRPGQYQSHWRMCQGDEGFGHRVWCSIIVDEPETLELQSQSVIEEEVPVEDGEDKQQMEEPELEIVEVIEDLTNKEDHSEDSISDEENCIKGSCESISAQDMLAFELLDIQESNTPNNTPIDMTPRISPLPLDENLLQQQIFKCSAASSSSSVELLDTPEEEQNDEVEEPQNDGLSVTDELEHLEIISETDVVVEEDATSEFSHLSDDTLEDFCIVPLPECFDRTLPLDKSTTSSQIDDKSETESSYTDSGVVASEVDQKTVDDMMATSQPNAQPEPLIPVTPMSIATPTVMSTIAVTISPTATNITTTEANEARDENTSDEEEEDHTEDDESVDVQNNDEANDVVDDDDDDDDESQDKAEDEDDKQTEATGDTLNDRRDDEAIQDEDDETIQEDEDDDEMKEATGGAERDEAWREEPAFNPVKAMEYAGGLAVQALSAAARTGSSVVSAILSPKVPPPRPQWPPETKEPQSPMDQLIDMGFCNRELNTKLLAEHNNNVARVVQELLSEAQNDWHSNRH